MPHIIKESVPHNLRILRGDEKISEIKDVEQFIAQKAVIVAED
jgi:hypothetical protein